MAEPLMVAVKGFCEGCCGQHPVRTIPETYAVDRFSCSFYRMESHLVGGDGGSIVCRGTDSIPEEITLQYPEELKPLVWQSQPLLS